MCGSTGSAQTELLWSLNCHRCPHMCTFSCSTHHMRLMLMLKTHSRHSLLMNATGVIAINTRPCRRQPLIHLTSETVQTTGFTERPVCYRFFVTCGSLAAHFVEPTCPCTMQATTLWIPVRSASCAPHPVQKIAAGAPQNNVHGRGCIMTAR